MNHKCFVVMPIGTQTIGENIITEDQLRQKYDYIIKNAIKVADPTLEVIRSDEELNPSSISNDIFTKLMYSEYVIADITYPNPNVFYELGIRHAISPGTILIREKTEFSIPFDISHLRYIEYTQDTSGMNKLSAQLKRRFEFYNKNPGKADNQFLELSSFINYIPTFYNNAFNKNANTEKKKAAIELFSMFFTNPALLSTITDNKLNENEQQSVMLEELGKNPGTAKQLISTLIESGLIDIGNL